jgi:hypothetical protein
MIVRLLRADLDELARLELAPAEALRIGAEALGARPTHDKPRERAGTTEALEELRHLYAEAVADMRLLQFSFATKAGDYAGSRARYEAVEGAMADLQRDVVPELRARLRELRAREQTLERRLAMRGVNVASIGPTVPAGMAVDTTPKPGEYDEPMLALRPLPPRRSLLARLVRLLTASASKPSRATRPRGRSGR